MATDLDNCRSIRRIIDGWLYDEPTAAEWAETTEHLATCQACRDHARFQNAMRESTRQAVHRTNGVPTDLEDRVRSALAKERRHKTAPTATPAHSQRAIRRGYLTFLILVPAAAGLLLAFTSEPETSETETPVSSASAAAPAVRATFASELIRLHTSEPTRTPTGSQQLAKLERELVLPVRSYPELESQGARPVSATAVTVEGQQLASLAYTLGRHRCTLYVFDSKGFPLTSSPELHPRVVNQQSVLAGELRGYSLATVERRGLGYAIASDLAVEKTAELAAAIH